VSGLSCAGGGVDGELGRGNGRGATRANQRLARAGRQPSETPQSAVLSVGRVAEPLDWLGAFVHQQQPVRPVAAVSLS